MDSLSQIVLGAAVGESTLGKKLGYKAMLWGAVAGTLPDLDVISNFFVTSKTIQLQIHRSYTHAFFFQLIAAYLFALITLKIHPQISLKRWYVFWALGFTTHSILDCFTTYGTQVFLPFSNYLVGFNNISVVDPLYTLPFLGLLLLCMFFNKTSIVRQRLLIAAWSVSCLYMVLTFGAKYLAHRAFSSSLVNQKISVNKLSTSPTIFNAMFWAGIGISKDTIYLSEYSIWQKNNQIEWQRYAIQDSLINDFKSPSADVLKWFSQGKYIIERPSADTLNFFIAKWGRQDYRQQKAEKTFRFFYQLYRKPDGTYEIIEQQRFDRGELKQGLADLWRRIFYS